jgi:2-oxoglutarate ferredoxin oxidoreductase subunit beta
VREEKVNRIYLQHGEEITFGAEDGRKGVRQRSDGSVEIVDASDGPLLVHDADHAEPSLAFALSRLTWSTVGAVPIGIFRSIEQPVYDEGMAEQLAHAVGARGEGDLEKLLHAGDTWQIG